MMNLLQRLDGRVGSLHPGGGRSEAREYETAKKTRRSEIAAGESAGINRRVWNVWHLVR